MTPLMAWAVVAGLGLGLGLWSLVSLAPRLRRPRLVDRVAPYVSDVSVDARRLVAREPLDPVPVVGALVTPPLGWLHDAVARAFGGDELIARRLHQSKSSLTVDALRSQLLVWATGGLAIGIVVVIVAGRAQYIAPVIQIALVTVFGVGGAVVRDQLLTRAAKARLARMAEELPTVLEFLTLSLSAGEGILDSLRRVARIGKGELAAEFAEVAAEVNSGVPLAESLSRLASSLELPPLTRCIEQVTGALDRGTPLAEVLRAQAQDVRDDQKRVLLELAGRKEVAMLVPLVFLILPVTIAFAIFPGLLVLQLGF